MATLSFAQLEGLWIQAGGPKLVAPLAAAIALAESSGNPAAVNPTDNGGTQTSWGLWQISDGTHNQPVANILDPRVNARAAVAKYTGAGNTFRPWGTYATGAYKRYLPSGYVAPANTTGGSSGGLSGALDSALQDLGSAVTNPLDLATALTSIAKSFSAIGTIAGESIKAFEWLFVPSHWIRIMAFGFGAGIMIPAVWALMRTGSGKSGDITLALGIFLTVLGGMLLFIAFHNLPEDVNNLSSLLGWISRSVQQGAAAVS
jgi:lysozyme-like protein